MNINSSLNCICISKRGTLDAIKVNEPDKETSDNEFDW